MDNRPIGMFDSGVGGISVLGEALRILPHEQFIYLGDTAHMPYGDKPVNEIIKLTRASVLNLVNYYHCKAVVIACNTATSAAAEQLRNELSIPIIGIEPALKPASLVPGNGKIAVLATKTTLSLPKFHHLMELYGKDAVPIPCPGLPECVETGDFNSSKLQALLSLYLEPLQKQSIKAVVLGCTHYPFLREKIAEYFPPTVCFFDGGNGTARQLSNRLKELSLLSDHSENISPILLSTKPGKEIIMRQMLDWWILHRFCEHSSSQLSPIRGISL